MCYLNKKMTKAETIIQITKVIGVAIFIVLQLKMIEILNRIVSLLTAL